MASKEEISNLNKHIIAVSGTQHDVFGLPNEGNLDFAINKANDQEDTIEMSKAIDNIEFEMREKMMKECKAISVEDYLNERR